ncbi:K(+)-transporting ATPase subunit F (plasmid) [Deinococcus wulumuqiensis R12]|nr:K(+)-transporting ATPase subunit F [Deinococcus wulumuqiensis R12]
MPRRPLTPCLRQGPLPQGARVKGQKNYGYPAPPPAHHLLRPVRRLLKRHGQTMILLLALISVLLFGYLLYSLLRPEDF